MLTVDDHTLLTEFEKGEVEEPSPTKVIDETRTIYGSRKLGLPKGLLWGHPVLCDFGEARIGQSHKGLIQPEVYRAPEVLFNIGWSFSVDIWNVAVLVSLSITDGLRQNHLMNDPTRYGICLKINICSMLWTKLRSGQHHTTLLRWLDILEFLP